MNKNTGRSSALGTIELLLAPLVWGYGFIVIRDSLDSIPIELSMSLRYLIAVPPLLLLFHKKLHNLKKSTVLRGSVLGVLLFLAQYFQTAALYDPEGSAGQVAFLTGLYVIEVPLLEFFLFHRKVRVPHIMAAVLMVPGILLLNGSLSSFSEVRRFYLPALIGSLFFALQIIFSDRFTEKDDPVTLSILQFSAAAICGVLLLLMYRGPLKITPFSTDVFIGILYLGIAMTMLGFLLQLAGQQKVSAGIAAILLSTETLFGMFFSIILDAEVITTAKICGCALIFAAILLVEIFEIRQGTT